MIGHLSFFATSQSFMYVSLVAFSVSQSAEVFTISVGAVFEAHFQGRPAMKPDVMNPPKWHYQLFDARSRRSIYI